MREEAAVAVRMHAAFVWRVLHHLGVPEHQLEHVSQAVLVDVHRKLREFRGESPITCWIYGICRELAAEQRPQQTRSHERTAPEPPAQEPARLELTRRLYLALQALAEHQRMVFVLYEIERLPMCDVAAAIGCSAGRAYAWLYAAREHLRRTLLRAGMSDRDRSLASVT